MLFDDTDTIRCKLNLGKKMAFPYAFLPVFGGEDLLENCAGIERRTAPSPAGRRRTAKMPCTDTVQGIFHENQ